MCDQAEIERFYTVDEVADYFRLSTRSIHRLIEKGELVAHRFGRAVRIAKSSIDAFLAARSLNKKPRK
jgi:excisionase family DNA binding protein